MYFCAAGDTHGALDRFYDNVLAFEQVLGLCFDWVLHVGDFGIWPEPARIDRATRKHGDIGDFPAWLEEERTAPRPTLFIKGNHEDFDWLDARPPGPVLPGLFHLRNGHVMDLGDADTGTIRVGGVGGCYGPSNYTRESRRLQSYAKRHYTFDEVEKLSSTARVDIVLSHDAPKGFLFERHRHGRSFVSPAEGLDAVLARTRPRVCFFGHHHTRVDGEVSGVRCIGLNLVGRPGHLVAFEMTPRESAWSMLGEY